MTSLETLVEPRGDHFEPLSETDVKLIEQAIGYALPSDYIVFLRKYGWCRFTGDAKVALPGGERYPIAVLFGRGRESGSLLRTLELSPDLREEGALPIARDRWGNTFVLDLKNGGPVFFLDFSGTAPKAVRVAATFSELVSAIKMQPWDGNCGA